MGLVGTDAWRLKSSLEVAEAAEVDDLVVVLEDARVPALPAVAYNAAHQSSTGFAVAGEVVCLVVAA